MKVCLLGADAPLRGWLDRLALRSDVTVAGFGQPEASPALSTALGAQPTPTDELLADPTVEAVIVAGPSGERAAWAARAARASKAIFVAVPDTSSLADWQDALHAAAEAGVPFLAAFELRFDPRIQHLKSAVSTDALGRAMAVQLHSTTGVERFAHVSAGLLDDLDLVRWLAGASPDEVYAFVGSGDDTEDLSTTLTICLRFAGGGVATVQRVQRCGARRSRRTEVYGTKATLTVLEEAPAGLQREDAAGFSHVWSPPAPSTAAQTRLVDAAMDHFISALEHDEPHVAGPEDLRATLVMLDAVERSIATRQPVRLDD